MTRKQHHLTIKIPIPAELPPETVLEAIQRYTPVIRHQALVKRFQQTSVSIQDVLADPFFREDGMQIVSFKIFEKITVVPGVASKEISFPVVFQRFHEGIRFRTHALAGVVLWGDYTVRRRNEETISAVTKGLKDGMAAQSNDDGALFEVAEEITVECNSLMMPLVKGQMEGAHRDICEKIIREEVGNCMVSNRDQTQRQNEAPQAN